MESTLARHERIALSFSGGKDSLACIYLLIPHLDRLTVYHLDTGDLMPETAEIIDHAKVIAPHFVTIQGDSRGWIAMNGMPSDLVPYGAHAIGHAIGQAATPIVHRYECCYQNLMRPLYERMKADGNTLIIRGTKRADMPRLALASGETDDGIEVLHPVENWSDAEVLTYLRSVGAPVARMYEEGGVSLPDCARCTAWWSEGRMGYLKRHYPALAADYRRRLDMVVGALTPAMRTLAGELAA